MDEREKSETSRRRRRRKRTRRRRRRRSRSRSNCSNRVIIYFRSTKLKRRLARTRSLSWQSLIRPATRHIVKRVIQQQQQQRQDTQQVSSERGSKRRKQGKEEVKVRNKVLKRSLTWTILAPNRKYSTISEQNLVAMLEKRVSYIDSQLNQKRQVTIKTCADVYGHWRTYKRSYKRAPRDGVQFKVDYIDTGLALSESERANAPVVLAVHGAPGSYHDFSLLINHLSQQKVRVLAPNFPEYLVAVKPKVTFRHSADEKAAYLRDFLKAIRVSKIDLLVSHSSAIFPTLLLLLNGNKQAIEVKQLQQEAGRQQIELNSITQTLTNNKIEIDIEQPNENQINNALSDKLNNCDNSEEEDSEQSSYEDAIDHIETNATNDKQLARKMTRLTVKSKKRRRSSDVIVQFNEPIDIRAIALLNPAGHRMPRSMKPTWYKCGAVPMYQHKFCRSLFRKFGPAVLTVIGVPVRVDNMDNVLLSATVMRNSKCHRVVNQLKQLSELKIPTLFVFSENDQLIEKEIFYEMTQLMSLKPEQFDTYTKDGDIELSQSQMKDWIRVMVFKDGGHYAYSNYARIVNSAVSELLVRVCG